MASLNPISRELVFKVVFCGPGLGGKTTTLEQIHAQAAPENRGQLVSLATASDRTLYFDFLPLRFPKVRGLSVRVQLFTVPGQVHYAATRKLVLTGCDGVVFVADAQAARVDANAESLEDLESHLKDLGRSLQGTPHVLQWNKTDLENLTPIAELEAKFNKHKASSFATCAREGRGVQEVLEAIGKLTIDSYLATVPAAKTAATQKIKFSPEGVGLANAVRDWTEGRSPSENVRAATAVAAEDPARESREERDVDGSAPESAEGPVLQPRRDPAASSRPRSPRPQQAPVHPSETSFFPPTAKAIAPAASPSSEPRSSDARFSLAALFPEEERTDVRGIEELVTRGDTRGAVLACEMLVARALATIAEERGAAWLLAGLDAGNYRAFRAIVEAAQKNQPIAKEGALSCVVWAANAALAARR